MAAAFAIGLFRIDFYSIWLDEYSTLEATRSWSNLKAYISAFPEQHPLYYIVIKWLHLNASLIDIRLFSLICGVLCLLPLHFIGRKLFSVGTTRLACILYTLSPFILYYNQEGRMYTLFMLLALLQISALIRWALDEIRSYKYVFVIFSIIALYTHFFASFLLAVEFIWLIAMAGKKIIRIRLKETVGVFAVVGLLYTPWLVHILTNIGGMSQDWRNWLNIALGIPYTFFRFSAGYGIFPLNYDTKAQLASHLPYAFFWILVFILSYSPAILLAARRWKETTPWQGLVIVLAFTPIVLVVAASFFKNVVSERYVIYSAPFFYLAVASAYETEIKWNRLGRIAVLCFPAIFGVVGILFYFFNPDFGKTNYKTAARYLIESNNTKSQVLCIPRMISGPLQYYLKNRLITISLSDWEVANPSSDVWVIERMITTGGYFDLHEKNFEKVSEILFHQENGLKVSNWRFVGKKGSSTE